MRQRFDTSSRGSNPGQRPAAESQSGYSWSPKDLAGLSPSLAELPGNQRAAAATKVLAGAGISGRVSHGGLIVADPVDPDEVERVLAAG